MSGSFRDYPRPRALEPSVRRVRIEFAGQIIADSRAALRILETSHPPTTYFPPADVATAYLLSGEADVYGGWSTDEISESVEGPPRNLWLVTSLRDHVGHGGHPDAHRAWS